jgi:hypothetical protein
MEAVLRSPVRRGVVSAGQAAIVPVLFAGAGGRIGVE